PSRTSEHRPNGSTGNIDAKQCTSLISPKVGAENAETLAPVAHSLEARLLEMLVAAETDE
ncbi:hypothetical protein E4U43_003866, partial [Claviceps pusilla]